MKVFLSGVGCCIKAARLHLVFDLNSVLFFAYRMSFLFSTLNPFTSKKLGTVYIRWTLQKWFATFVLISVCVDVERHWIHVESKYYRFYIRDCCFLFLFLIQKDITCKYSWQRDLTSKYYLQFYLCIVVLSRYLSVNSWLGFGNIRIHRYTFICKIVFNQLRKCLGTT